MGIWNLEDDLVLLASIISADLSRNKFTSIYDWVQMVSSVGCDWWILLPYDLFISLSQGYYVITITINGSQKCIYLIGFEISFWMLCKGQ